MPIESVRIDTARVSACVECWWSLTRLCCLHGFAQVNVLGWNKFCFGFYSNLAVGRHTVDDYGGVLAWFVLW